jgi:serine/threonine-protein kinase RsbT
MTAASPSPLGGVATGPREPVAEPPSDQIELSILIDTDIVAVRQRARELAVQLGFPRSDGTLLATAVSELARNLIQYARGGVIALSAVHRSGRSGIRVQVEDQGPGIADVSLALQDGFSTSGGLGLGLPGVKRLMDELEIQSEVGKGTRIVAVLWGPFTGLNRSEEASTPRQERKKGKRKR